MKTLINLLEKSRNAFGLILFFLVASPAVFAQNIAINTTGAPASASAILDLTNSASMALLVPPVVLTNASVLAPVPGPGPAGLMVYNSSNSVANGLNGAGYYYWNGSAWLSIGSIAASTVMGAIDGTSLSGTNVILGNAFGSTLGQLTQNTEIPFNGNNLTFSNVGGAGKIGINLGASTSAAQALEIGGTTNTARIDGLGTGNSFNAASAATTNYLLYANASGDIYSIPSASTNGYVLTYSTTNGPTWQAASGGVTAANNGLSLAGSTVQMGGPLIQNTSVGLAGYILTFDAGTFNVNSTSGGTTNIGTGGSGATNIGTGATGAVNIGNSTGGTFFPAMSTANGVYFSSNASGLLAQTAAGTTGQVLFGNTGSAPTWGGNSTTALTGGPIGSVLSNSAANTPAWNTTPSTGSLLIGNGAGVPTWLADVAAGSVLYSKGTTSAPAWNAAGTAPTASSGTAPAGDAQVLVSQGTSAPTWVNAGGVTMMYYDGFSQAAGGLLLAGAATDFFGSLYQQVYIAAGEFETQIVMPKCVVTRIRVYVLANTLTGASTFFVRQNAANSTLSAAVPAGSTGAFNGTGNVTFNDGDLLSVSGVLGATAAKSIEVLSIQIVYYVLP